jgi:hypothetical protein
MCWRRAWASHVLGDQGEPIPRVLIIEELADRQDVWVARQVCERTEGVADELDLPLALLDGQIRVDLVDP